MSPRLEALREAYEQLAAAQWEVFRLVVYKNADATDAASRVAIAHSVFMARVDNLNAKERARVCNAIDVLDDPVGAACGEPRRSLSERQKLESLGHCKPNPEGN